MNVSCENKSRENSGTKPQLLKRCQKVQQLKMRRSCKKLSQPSMPRTLGSRNGQIGLNLLMGSISSLGNGIGEGKKVEGIVPNWSKAKIGPVRSDLVPFSGQRLILFFRCLTGSREMVKWSQPDLHAL